LALNAVWTSTVPSTSGNIRLFPRKRGGLIPVSQEAVAQWSLLVFIAFLDGIWLVSAGFQLGPGYIQALGWIGLLILISIFYFYTGRDQRIMEFAHFAAQLLSLYALLMPLSYLAVATDFPLVDQAFDFIDKSLGLDWVAWTQWVQRHPRLELLLFVAYGSLPFQALVCYIYNVHTRSGWRNSEIWWITLISALVTIAGSALFPASNPYVYYGLDTGADFLDFQHFLRLRDGAMHVIGLTDAQGLIQLPSFHTVLAIMFTYNLRHNRWLFAIALLLNTVLILSCPTEGSHYFIDLFAGAIVAAATICGVRHFRSRFGEPFLPMRAGIGR
jgi:PAP2 superfamily